MEGAIKGEFLEVTNVRIGTTSLNSWGQKLAVVKVVEQYRGNSLTAGKSELIVWYVEYKCR